MNTALTETAIKLARESKIKYQIEVEPSGDSGTNARAIQVSRTGVATAVFCVPMRYMHSANEVLSLEDIEETARLLCETAKILGG
jgi:endoglucanase